MKGIFGKNEWTTATEAAAANANCSKCSAWPKDAATLGESARVRTEQEWERASERGDASASYCRLFGVGASFTHSRLELLQFECVVSEQNERECSSYSLSLFWCSAAVREGGHDCMSESNSLCAHTQLFLCFCVFCLCFAFVHAFLTFVSLHLSCFWDQRALHYVRFLAMTSSSWARIRVSRAQCLA